MRERQHLDSALANVRDLERGITENVELIELAEAESDEAMVGEAEKALRGLRDLAAKHELETNSTVTRSNGSKKARARKRASSR